MSITAMTATILNRISQLDDMVYADKYASEYPERFLRDIATIRINLGRRGGHTSAAKELQTTLGCHVVVPCTRRIALHNYDTSLTLPWEYIEQLYWKDHRVVVVDEYTTIVNHKRRKHVDKALNKIVTKHLILLG